MTKISPALGTKPGPGSVTTSNPNTMNMTTEQWFQFLPEPIREAAIRNTNEFSKLMLKAECRSLDHAIVSAFPWKDSPEGVDRWCLIHSQVLKQQRELAKVWDLHQTQEEARIEALELADTITPN